MSLNILDLLAENLLTVAAVSVATVVAYRVFFRETAHGATAIVVTDAGDTFEEVVGTVNDLQDGQMKEVTLVLLPWVRGVAAVFARILTVPWARCEEMTTRTHPHSLLLIVCTVVAHTPLGRSSSQTMLDRFCLSASVACTGPRAPNAHTCRHRWPKVFCTMVDCAASGMVHASPPRLVILRR